MTKLVNLRHEKYDVYIGRGSKWGNPYIIGRHGDRKRVVAKHREHLWCQYLSGLITDQDLLKLDGKTLGCFCAPELCHGENIISLIEYVKNGSKDDS